MSDDVIKLCDDVDKALAAATPGPWFATSGNVVGVSWHAKPIAIPDEREDARLIAHAPEWLRALVDHARKRTDTWGQLVREKAAIEADERKRIKELLRGTVKNLEARLETESDSHVRRGVEAAAFVLSAVANELGLERDG